MLLLNFSYINLLFSGTYKIEAYLDNKFTGDTKLPENRTYRTFSLNGMWKDNLGDIGLMEAFGKVESLSEKPNLEVMSIQTSEDGDKSGEFIEEIVLMLMLEEEVHQCFLLEQANTGF